jgi:hypothetical protein
MRSYHDDPAYQAAEDQQRIALQAAEEVIRRAQREPDGVSRGYLRSGGEFDPAQPTLARLRTPHAGTIKAWLRSYENRTKIEYARMPGVLADKAREILSQGADMLEGDLDDASERTRVRLQATIDAFREAADELDETEQALKDAINAWRRREHARFRQDSKRFRMLQTHAMWVSWVYDFCDNCGVEYLKDGKWSLNVSYKCAYELLSACANKVGTSPEDPIVADIDEALRFAEQMRYVRAIDCLERASERFPLSDERD